ncbi:MAG: arginyltransferase [Nitrosomonas sp.]|nr:MAG: arginyltransferase [Nitrosomonas sp.]
MRLVPLDAPPHQCAYLPDRDAVYESFLVLEATPQERQALLEAGYRSFGKYYFRPCCIGCHQCIPLRVPVEDFTPNKSQRRAWRRCRDVDVVVDKPRYTKEKWEIYHDHLQRFNREESISSAEDFAFSFYDTTIPALEFCYYVEGVLAAVGIVNVTPQALSSVYFTYRLDYAKLSLGTYSVMAEIDYARRNSKKYLYLGYYVRDNHFMSYKARFHPNEVLMSGSHWVPFYDTMGNLWSPEPPREI